MVATSGAVLHADFALLHQDLVEGLRPGLVRLETYEEAAAAVADIEAAEAAAAAAGEESDASDSDAGSDADGGATQNIGTLFGRVLG